MSLQRRLLLYLLLCAPLVWALAAWTSWHRARQEIDELFDSEMIRFARQVQATLGSMPSLDGAAPMSAAPPAHASRGDVKDLALAVWDAHGRLLLVDREGTQLRWRADASGFVDETIDGRSWRVYYLQSASGRWLVAAGQDVDERDELSSQITGSQLLTWVATLPVLLLAMALAVRQALSPVHRLSRELHGRGATDLQPLRVAAVPADLRPLVEAMNAVMARLDDVLSRERRFTADAAHELRTPLAVLRLQWEAVSGARDPVERAQAGARLAASIERVERLVVQLLALARVEAASAGSKAAPLDWSRLAAQVVDDVLPLAERRRIELACEWPPQTLAVLPLRADEALLSLLLRNLVDNAVRYAPSGSTVTLRFAAERIEVDNDGPPLPATVLERLGERFYRPEGQAEPGSGLGVSIARRIAALYGLELDYGTSDDGRGVRATLCRAGR